MIFYGSKASTIKDGQINNVTCPDCETQTSMHYAIFGKYAHVYWIPLFPMGKTAVLECNHCKKTNYAKDLPEEIKRKFMREKEGVRAPIWNFAGLGVIGAIILFGMYTNSQTKASEKEYINQPKIGDTYYMGSSVGNYSSAIITKIEKDSVYVLVNNYEVDRRSDVDEIDIDENYTDAYEVYAKKDLINMYSNKNIYEINRD